MTDTLTPDARAERMSRVRGRDTGPEMVVPAEDYAHSLLMPWNQPIDEARPG